MVILKWYSRILITLIFLLFAYQMHKSEEKQGGWVWVIVLVPVVMFLWGI